MAMPPLRSLLVLALLLGCPADDDDDAPGEGRNAGECSDGADNDGDGLFDCDDPDCAGAPSCADDDDASDDDDGTPDDDDSTPVLSEAKLTGIPTRARNTFPSDAPAFVDRTAAQGLDYPLVMTDYGQLFDQLPGDSVKMFGGFSVADLNGDGHLDLLFTERDQPLRVFLGDGELGFSSADASSMGLPVPGNHAVGSSVADAEGDGDNDVLIVGQETRFFENDGSGQFTEATERIGALGAGDWLEPTASWADFDHDGDLDVFLASRQLDPEERDVGRDRLLVQGDDGSFTDRIDDLLPESLDGAGWIGGWFDADLDGWLDLYLIHSTDPEKGGSNVFVRNLGAPAGDGWGFEVRLDDGLDLIQRAMGLAVGDYDLDGDFDLHITDIGPTFLAKNEREFGFVDASNTISADTVSEFWEFSWATIFLDHDNDGSPELFTAFGVDAGSVLDPAFGDNGESADQRDRLWRLDSGVWVDIAEDAGVDDPRSTRSAVAADLNRDGCIDLVTWRLTQGAKLYEGNCGGGGALLIQLELGGKNPAAIGARIEAFAQGQLVAHGQIEVGSTGVFSSGPAELHLGLGSRDAVDLVVHWPDGVSTRNDGVAADQIVTLSR